MKKFCVLFLFFIPAICFAQNVAINNDGSQADATALLDIKSNSKGLLIPRLTTGERTGINSPAVGLTVFDTNTFSFWLYRGELNGGWVQLVHSMDKEWSNNGPNIFNTNNGNVGIGINNPSDKLAINGTDPTIQMLNASVPKGFLNTTGDNLRIGTYFNNNEGKLALVTKGTDRLLIDKFGRVSIGTSSDFDAELKLNGSSPRFAFMNNDVAKGFIKLSADDIKMGTYPGNSGNVIIAPKGVDKIWVDEDGKMGIGTSTPSSLLTINGTNPWIQMRQNNVDKGFFQLVGDDIRVGTNSTNNTGNLVFQTKLVSRMLIDENGKVGIGTNSPSSVLTVNGSEPIIQLRNDDTDRGFVQLVGNDMKVGTNVSNTYGRFFVRTGGADRLVVNYDGKVGIGTAFPYAPLTINASIPKIDFSISDTRYGHLGIEGVNEDFVIQRDDIGTGKMIIKNGNGWAIHLFENGYFNYGTGLNPQGYPFSVTGKILATDFVSLAVANWPDYVFADGYNLKPLEEVKKFIQENKHLPGIPAAIEIEKEGLPLGDMSKRLMEKVEELTLYIIQLQEQLDELKKKEVVPQKNQD